LRDVWERWLGAGLAAVLGIATLVIALTGRLGLFLNPAGSWFAIAMAVVAIGVGIVGFALPLGIEREHDHRGEASADHDHDHGRNHVDEQGRGHSQVAVGRASTASIVGGAIASTVVVAAWLLPPTTLSVTLAMDRATNAPALFGRDDAVELASSGDTREFGIPDWSTVFATATSPEDFAGDAVELEGFVTPHPDDPDQFLLTRLVITHCVIDAQPAAVPVSDADWDTGIEVGDWARVEGTVVLEGEELTIRPTTLTRIEEPQDPYEY
jgi:uncharacterized repeat protein (TIGR03943 family)